MEKTTLTCYVAIFCLLVQHAAVAVALFDQSRSRRSLNRPSEDDWFDQEDGLLSLNDVRFERGTANETVMEFALTQELFQDREPSPKLSDDIQVKVKAWKDKQKELYDIMAYESNRPLKRIRYTSKYLWDQTFRTIRTHDELKKECEHWKLEPPQVRSKADFQSLQNLVKGAPSIIVGLGLTDKDSKGKFFEADGKTPISFQMFDMGQPDNLNRNEHCVTLSLVREKEVVMKDVNCDEMNVHFICQRTDDSLAQEDSLENAAMLFDGLDMVGDAGSRRIYIGRNQKTWKDAEKHCEEENKKLLDLTTNEENNQQLYRQILEWSQSKELRGVIGIWTSGKFSSSTHEDTFTWQSSNVEFDVKQRFVMWQWAAGEPADQTNVGLELCIDVSVPDIYQPGQNMTPWLRASNCHLPFYYACYEEFRVDPSCRVNGPFVQTGPHSKFLIDKTMNDTTVTRELAKEQCEKWDYELADIRSDADIKQLMSFLTVNTLEQQGIEWHLGLTDKDREGEFYEGDKVSPIAYQVFSSNKPDNENNADCVVLRNDPTEKQLIMEDRNCNSYKARILCQYQKDTTCFLRSQETVEKAKDELIFLGETSTRRYFYSSVQKKWVDAMESCSSNKKTLLDFHIPSDVNNFRKPRLLPKLWWWSRRFGTGLWTSGRFMRSVEDTQFRWETSGEMFRMGDLSMNLTWAPGEPSDNTKRKMEICVEIDLSHWKSALVNVEDPSPILPAPLLKASNCLLPNYYICYEDAPHLKNCHWPPKVEVGFKTLSESSRYLIADTNIMLNAADGRALCNEWGYDVAEVSSLRDYLLVSTSLDAMNVTDLNFGLGMNSERSEGIWYEGDGFTPVKFQAFGEGQPTYVHNAGERLDHVTLSKSPSPAWKMSTVSARHITNILCQFKKRSSCSFNNVYTYLDRTGRKDYLTKLTGDAQASSSGITFYIGDSQQNWEDAMRFCWSRGKKLLDLNFKLSEIQRLYGYLVIFLQQRKIHPSVFRFWTSGKYVESFEDQQFRWESIAQFVTHNQAERDLSLRMVSPPPSNTTFERCLSLGLPNPDASWATVGSFYTATLKASNCNLPHFFVCYEESSASTFPSSPTSQNTTPSPKKTNDQSDLCTENPDPDIAKQQKALKLYLGSTRPAGFLLCDKHN